MKIKLGQWGEFDFDKADAAIAVPLVLLPLGFAFTPINKAWLWSGGAAYYLLLFFLQPFALGLKKTLGSVQRWWTFRCPYCKSREMVEQGLQEYHGDVPYYFHICNRCKSTSVLVGERLLKATRKAEIEITD